MARKNAGSAEAGPPVLIFPQDLQLLLKVLPRVQIVVGDIPQLVPMLQRIERAANTGKAYAPVEPKPAPELELEGDGEA